METVLISVKEVSLLIKLNDIINDEPFNQLSIKMGPDRDYIIDVKSMLSMISIFNHTMYMVIDGDKSIINDMIDRIESIDGMTIIDL